MKLPKLKRLMTSRERAEKLVYVISQMMVKKPTPKNISRSTDWVEGRFDMGAKINDQLMFRIEDKLKGNFVPIKKSRSKANPVRQRKGWKIQTGSGNGWSDIKVSSGSDFYRNWHFKTKPDAQSELNELARIHGDPESYRIVPAATEQDFDLYNPVHRKNPVRQRIAVSLSRSQVRRNPFNDRNLDA